MSAELWISNTPGGNPHAYEDGCESVCHRLVVIDPEDREQVKRLEAPLQAALREFANPTPMPDMEKDAEIARLTDLLARCPLGLEGHCCCDCDPAREAAREMLAAIDGVALTMPAHLPAVAMYPVAVRDARIVAEKYGVPLVPSVLPEPEVLYARFAPPEGETDMTAMPHDHSEPDHSAALDRVAKAMYETCGFDLYVRDIGPWDAPDLGSTGLPSEYDPPNSHRVNPEKPRWRARAQVVLDALYEVRK
jgi:hypothetical protein